MLISKFMWKIIGLKQRCQRFKRGYSYGDIWNLDIWFVNTCEPMLRHLKETHTSRPDKYTDEEWTRRLGEMADCLHKMREDNVRRELLEKGEYSWTKLLEIMEENKTKFFEMFSEDFYHLWD